MMVQSKVDLLINHSASPWHREKIKQREALVQAATKKCQCPIVYCNSIGGNDELIFDGNSQGLVPHSTIPLAQLPAFEMALEIVDTAIKPKKNKFDIPCSRCDGNYRACAHFRVAGLCT